MDSDRLAVARSVRRHARRRQRVANTMTEAERQAAFEAFAAMPEGPPISFNGSGLREGTTKMPGFCALHPSGQHCRCTW
jgi:hypothetical protein